MDGLDEESSHNVTLTNLDENDSRPLYFDYAVVSSTRNESLSTTPSSTSGDGARHVPVAAIVVAVFGALAVAFLLFFVYYLIRRRRRSGAVLPTSNKGSMTNVEPYILPFANPNRNGAPMALNPSSTNYPFNANTNTNPPSIVQSFNPSSTSAGRSSHAATESFSISGSETMSSLSGPPPGSNRREKGGARLVVPAVSESSQAIQEEDAGIIAAQQAGNASPSRLPPAYDPTWVQNSSNPSR
jgi:hypothetical protein